MLHHLPRSFPQHHPILRYALDTYYGCLQSSYICGYKDSTLSMLHHLPRSFPQHHPILRYALDTYYGCLQSSYICGYKASRRFEALHADLILSARDFHVLYRGNYRCFFGACKGWRPQHHYHFDARSGNTRNSAALPQQGPPSLSYFSLR
ncbi:uncharacterized protein LOC143302760 isoform X2 [Bombus vancouverensis nearcticus]|uniref:uncharacterized protein LOC143302760 isoform X2 n=1 Tax=Bombus vancouverensis nearcticus TaxID=2705178 RepID=UPI00402B6A59